MWFPLIIWQPSPIRHVAVEILLSQPLCSRNTTPICWHSTSTPFAQTPTLSATHHLTNPFLHTSDNITCFTQWPVLKLMSTQGRERQMSHLSRKNKYFQFPQVSYFLRDRSYTQAVSSRSNVRKRSSAWRDSVRRPSQRHAPLHKSDAILKLCRLCWRCLYIKINSKREADTAVY